MSTHALALALPIAKIEIATKWLDNFEKKPT